MDVVAELAQLDVSALAPCPSQRFRRGRAEPVNHTWEQPSFMGASIRKSFLDRVQLTLVRSHWTLCSNIISVAWRTSQNVYTCH